MSSPMKNNNEENLHIFIKKARIAFWIPYNFVLGGVDNHVVSPVNRASLYAY